MKNILLNLTIKIIADLISVAWFFLRPVLYLILVWLSLRFISLFQ